MENTNRTLPDGLEIPNHTKLYRKIKIISLAVLTAIFFGLTWWLSSIALFENKHLLFWLWPNITSIMAVSFLSFFALTNNSRTWFWVLNASILAMFVLIMPKDIYVWAGGIVFLLLTMFYEKRIRADEHARADFSITRLLRANIVIMVYALLVLVGFILYYNTSEDFKKNPEQFYDKLGESTAKSLPYFSKGLGGLGGVDSTQSLDEFIIKQAEKEDPEFRNASPEQKEQALEEFKTQLEEQFNVNTSGSEELSQIMAKVITDKIKETSKPYEKFFPLIFTLIILAFMRTFAFIYNWIAVFFGWLLFKILLSLKFFGMERVQVEVNKLKM